METVAPPCLYDYGKFSRHFLCFSFIFASLLDQYKGERQEVIEERGQSWTGLIHFYTFSLPWLLACPLVLKDFQWRNNETHLGSSL